jgi:hypothetical protein
MEALGMKFYDWLGAYQAEQTPWGDFARDTRRDPTFPKGVRSLKGVLRHLRGADEACLAAARTSWAMYKASAPVLYLSRREWM